MLGAPRSWACARCVRRGWRGSTRSIFTRWLPNAEAGALLAQTLVRRVGIIREAYGSANVTQATIVGDRYDFACHDLRDFMARNQIVFEWLDPSDPVDAQCMPPAVAADVVARRAAPRRSRALRAGLARIGGQPQSADAAAACRVRRRHYRRRAGRAGGRGLRRIRRAAHDDDRARGARRAGPYVIAHRELFGFPGRFRRRTCQSRAAASQAFRDRDSRYAHGAGVVPTADGHVVHLDGGVAVRCARSSSRRVFPGGIRGRWRPTA